MKKIFVCLSFVMLLCLALNCFAENEFVISDSSYDPETRQLSLIVNDNRVNSASSAASAEVTVNEVKLDEPSLTLLPDSSVPVTYCFVVDTSPTALPYQKKAAGDLASALAKKHTNVKAGFILISFNNNGASLLGSGPYTNALFNKLNYDVSGAGDASEALDLAIKELRGEPPFGKKVIVLISDGNWTSTPYLEADQLLTLVQESGYPVFSWGMAVSEETKGYSAQYNDKYLKRLEDLSGISGGKFFTNQNDKNPANQIYNQNNKSAVVTGKFPEDYSHEAGASDISVKLQSRNGTNLGLVQPFHPIELPLIEAVKTAEELVTETPGPTPTEEPLPTPTPAGFAGTMQEKLGENWKLILAAGVLAVILVALIILTLRKKEPPFVDEKIDDEKDGNGGIGTEIIQDKKVTVTLTRLDNPAFKVTVDLQNGTPKYFGRDTKGNVTGLGGDSVISGKHFSLTYENDKVVLDDCKSTNHSYLVNGSRRDLVTGPVQVRDGAVIGVANKDFSLRISGK